MDADFFTLVSAGAAGTFCMAGRSKGIKTPVPAAEKEGHLNMDEPGALPFHNETGLITVQTS